MVSKDAPRLDLWRLFLATKLWGKQCGHLSPRPLRRKAKRAETREPGFAARVQGRMHHEGAFRRAAKRLCPRRAIATS